MKKTIFAVTLLLFAGFYSLAAAEKTAKAPKPQFSKWALRADKADAGKAVVTGRDIQVTGNKKIVMTSVNNAFRVAPFDKVTLKAKFKGKAILKMGFHVYSKTKYLTTFDGFQLREYSPDKFTEIEYTHYVPSDENNYKPMEKAIPCVYFYPGASCELKDFSWKVEKFALDTNSPLGKLVAKGPVKVPAKELLPMQKKLILPEGIYAVPGIECNVYFDNVFLSNTPNEFRFNVQCAKGTVLKDRWTFTAKDPDAGSYDFTLSVSSKDGKLLAQKKGKLFVAPKDAGKGKSYTLLMFGDSIIGTVKAFPERVHSLFQLPGNPELVMVGTRPRKGLKRGSMVHEGFPGWSWYWFTHNGPFVLKKDGMPVKLDVKGYFDRANGGKAPDFITIQLGVNDVFGRDDFRLPGTLVRVEKYMDNLLAELRKNAPNAVIGISYPTPASKIKNLAPKLAKASWRFQQNLFELNYMMQQKFPLNGKNDKKIFLIPVGTSLDTVQHFPAKDHVHPTPAGGIQLGNALYSFLKYQMSLKK